VSEERAVTTVAETAVSVPLSRLTPEQVALVKRTIAPAATDDELALFIETANQAGLNPFAREIYFVKYHSKSGPDKVSIITGIDGHRKFAERSAEYLGQVGPFWCSADGAWKDVWLDAKTRPAAAKVGVIKRGAPEPTWGIATWAEFGKAENLWLKYPTHMLAKCAERIALSKAFPHQTEDMRQRGIVVDEDYVSMKVSQLERSEAMPHRPMIAAGAAREEELFGHDETATIETEVTHTEPNPSPTPAQPAAVATSPAATGGQGQDTEQRRADLILGLVGRYTGWSMGSEAAARKAISRIAQTKFGRGLEELTRPELDWLGTKLTERIEAAQTSAGK